MKEEEYLKYKEDIIFKKIKALDQEHKKYGIINLSSKISDHKRQALSILDTGFNVSITVNSENPNEIYILYISTVTSKKSFFRIYLRELKKDANDGYLSFTEDPIVENGLVKIKKFYTGINNKYDITPFDIIQAVYLKTNDSNNENMIRNNIISSYISFPEDFPDNIYLAIVGCLCFDRGNTFQNISTGVVFTLGAQLSTAVKDITLGASVYQRLGRVLGNIKKDENHDIVYITEPDIIECSFANASIIDKLIDYVKRDGKTKIYIKNMCDIEKYIEEKEKARRIMYNI